MTDESPSPPPASSISADDRPGIKSWIKRVSAKLKLVPAIKGAAVWGGTAISGNALAILAIVIALKTDDKTKSLDAMTSYFFMSGNAATIAIGLAAGAVADLNLRTASASRAHMWLSSITILAIVVMAVFFPEVVTGEAGEEKIETVQTASMIMIVGAIALGTIAAVVVSLAQKSNAKASPIQGL